MKKTTQNKPTSIQPNPKQKSNNLSSSPFQQQFQANPSDQKLTTYMKTISQIQNTIARLQSQVQYYRNTNLWVEGFINSATLLNKQNNGKIGGMKSLMNASAKLNVFEKQAILGGKGKANLGQQKQKQVNKHQNIKQSQVNKDNICNISAHLRQILTPNIQKQNKIAQLTQTRTNLYTKLQQILQKQQPYLHQKILIKIQRQVTKHKKLQTIKLLKTLCKQKQNWLTQVKQQINTQIDEKLIQIKISANLSKMKQIMNKKISNDQYIGFISSNQVMNKNVGKFVKIGEEVKVQLRNRMGQLDKKKDGDVQQCLKQKDIQKLSRLNYVEIDNAFIDQLSEIIKQSEQSLTRPLGTQNTAFLLSQCDRLNKQLSLLTNKKF